INEKIKAGYIGCNAANLLYKYKDTIPGEDWSHLALDLVNFSGADLSGKDFSYTSFCGANLDNVNFTNANFTGCDLTGVELEEASPVRAVAVSRNENIYALYDDGIVREWLSSKVRAPHALNLGKIDSSLDIRLIAQPGSALTLFADNQLKFYDVDKVDDKSFKLSQRALIEVKPLLKPIRATHENLLLSEEKNNWYNLQLIDLENQSIIQSVSVKAFTLCADVGNKGFIIYDRNDGLQAAVPGFEIPKILIKPDTINITCLATYAVDNSEDKWRLAVGQDNGSIAVYNINLSTWDLEDVVKYTRHEKTVRHITFIDENRILSGGIDRKIFLTQIDHNGVITNETQEFRLHLQCKGMRIDGIQPETTRLALQKLIDTASSME
ncbi:MAG: pentapeptide repeat-containing protein, partial [Acidobacteria bacterium]|nr:pentapeptide repeat-containing protein [Acidobacteriota bacterium]